MVGSLMPAEGNVVSELQPGDPQAIGPYRLVGQLGQGGMGRVYLGVSPGGRPVAVKAIRAELAADPQFRTRFGREVAAARRVSGVFTAQVVDADVDGPVAWMATAYVPGPSLSDAVERNGPLPEASLLALAAGLAESLGAIHAAGVVHRDLKPSNVLLAEDGPRVIDFGISRAAAEATALTQTGLVVGSPGFMSPEQAMGNQVGPPSDVFNLGAVLAFAGTGEGPFGTGTTAALLYRVAHGTPNLDRVPPAVRPLIEHCLDKDPGRRPTAGGLLAAVGALQPGGDWLPDSFTRTFVSPVTPSGSALAASGPALAGSGPAHAWSGPAPAASGPAPAAPGAAPYPGLMTRTTGAGSAAQATGASQPFNAGGYGPTALSGSMPSSGASVPPYPPDGSRHAPSAGPDRPRRRLGRPMLLALLIGALLVISGATAFALTSFSGKSPAPVKDTPAAQTFSPTASPSAAHSSSAASARPYASPGASYPATAPSYTYQAPTATAAPSVRRSTPPTATASPSVRTPPSPTASVKTSPTVAPPSSPAPSPSATHSP
jgi:eukaryotic-like serine/threonine-protein kinase